MQLKTSLNTPHIRLQLTRHIASPMDAHFSIRTLGKCEYSCHPYNTLYSFCFIRAILNSETMKRVIHVGTK